jgi:hypothetical protein
MSNRRVDLGTAVVLWKGRFLERTEGVVGEIVPPQKFPVRYPSATQALDFRTRYVILTGGRTMMRSLEQLEIVAR